MLQFVTMPTPSPRLRNAVMMQAKRGDYASIAEVATVASVSRQTAFRWLQEAGIDLRAARIKYLAKLYVIEQAYLARISGAPRLTTEEKHRQMVDAVRRLNAAQVQRSVKKSG